MEVSYSYAARLPLDYQLFLQVFMYGALGVGQRNLANSVFQFIVLAPTGSNMLFHNAFDAENLLRGLRTLVYEVILNEVGQMD